MDYADSFFLNDLSLDGRFLIFVSAIFEPSVALDSSASKRASSSLTAFSSAHLLEAPASKKMCMEGEKSPLPKEKEPPSAELEKPSIQNALSIGVKSPVKSEESVGLPKPSPASNGQREPTDASRVKGALKQADEKDLPKSEASPKQVKTAERQPKKRATTTGQTAPGKKIAAPEAAKAEEAPLGESTASGQASLAAHPTKAPNPASEHHPSISSAGDSLPKLSAATVDSPADRQPLKKQALKKSFPSIREISISQPKEAMRSASSVAAVSEEQKKNVRNSLEKRRQEEASLKEEKTLSAAKQVVYSSSLFD